MIYIQHNMQWICCSIVLLKHDLKDSENNHTSSEVFFVLAMVRLRGRNSTKEKPHLIASKSAFVATPRRRDPGRLPKSGSSEVSPQTRALFGVALDAGTPVGPSGRSLEGRCQRPLHDAPFWRRVPRPAAFLARDLWLCRLASLRVFCFILIFLFIVWFFFCVCVFFVVVWLRDITFLR